VTRVEKSKYGHTLFSIGDAISVKTPKDNHATKADKTCSPGTYKAKKVV
jgi:hypothetical protein